MIRALIPRFVSLLQLTGCRSGSVLVAVLTLLPVLMLLVADSPAQAGLGQQRTRVALAAVDEQLGSGPNSGGWRKFLMLGELAEQLDADQPDRSVVATARDRFATDHSMLRGRVYVDARRALEAWLGELETPGPEALAELARSTAGQAQPASEAAAAAALQSLRDLAPQLDKYLASLKSAEQGWRDYLRWSEFQSGIESGQPDPSLLENASQCYHASYPLLADPAIQQAVPELAEAAQTLLSAATPKQEIADHLNELAENLTAYAQEPSPAGAQKICDNCAWLEARGIAGNVVSAAQRLFCHPNLRLDVSARLLAAGIDSDINDKGDFQETLLGTTYSGAATTRGKLELVLVPDPSHIQTRFDYRATVNSSSTGQKGPVTVQSVARTSVSGSKITTLMEDGFRLLPTKATATTSADISDIGGRRLARRAAEGRASSEKAATEQESARQAEQRLTREMDRRTNDLLAPLHYWYQYNIRLPLAGRGNLPSELQCWSTNKFARLSAMQPAAGQLGAPTEAPHVTGDYDLAVRVHESFLSGLGDGLLAGMTLRETELESQWDSLFGSVPEGIKTIDTERPWTLTFEREQPLMVKLSGGGLAVQIRAEQFTVGQESYPGMWITARYTLAATEAGLVGTRQGRLEIIPPRFDLEGGERLGVRQQVLRSMLRKRFDPIFTDELTFIGAELPGRWKKAGPLAMELIQADAGWLVLRAKLPQPVPATAASGR